MLLVVRILTLCHDCDGQASKVPSTLNVVGFAMDQVRFGTVKNDAHLEQILALQSQNLEGGREQRQQPDDGFVTVKHDFALLRDMNRLAPHVIALADRQVVAYALVMLEATAPRIPMLTPMFERFASINHQGQRLKDFKYFVMGQICVAARFRGQGVFTGLYDAMRDYYRGDYDFVLTEIATRNTRSDAAHKKVGFRTLERYEDETDEWEIVLWDWHV